MNTLDVLMRDAVNVLKGPDDPRIDEITAYMREYVRRCRKAKRSEFAEDDILASMVVPSAPFSRRTYRRY
jgi:hypothetical protein